MINFENFFFEKPEDYNNIDFQLSAPWPVEKNSNKEDTIIGGSLFVSGEMTAVTQNLVVVPYFRQKTTISWLISEEAKVNKGDVLARLDSTAIDESLTEGEKTTVDLEDALETAEVKLQKSQVKFEFDKKKLQNSLEIAKLNKDITLNPLRNATLINKVYAYQSSLIQAKHKKYLYDRLLNKPKHLIANAELAKAKLAYEEAVLNRDKSKIALDEEEKGATEADLAKIHAEFEIAQDNVNRTLARIPIDIEVEKNAVLTSKVLLENHQRNIKSLHEERENLVIKAPTKGTVLYKKLWGSQGVKKVETGTEVGSWNRILSLPETDEMTVKVKVLEKFFPLIKAHNKVKVTVPSIDNQIFEGTIQEPGFNFEYQTEIPESTDIYSSKEPTGKVFAIYTIKLPSLAKYKIKPGSVALVEIPLDKKEVK